MRGRAWLCALALLAAAGCAPLSQGAPSAQLLAGPAAPAAPSLALERGDKVRVTVFNEPQLSGEFTVEEGGAIAYPLLGQVEVAGLGARQVEARLAGQLRGRYLVDPKVSVEIISQRPFYILGEVGKAGEYPYRPGLNVVGAIALAGGFGPRAVTSHVLIRRARDTDQRQYPVAPTVAVYPGDMITVPERYF